MTNIYENVFPDNKKCFYYVLPDIIYRRYYPSNGNCEGEGKGESIGNGKGESIACFAQIYLKKFVNHLMESFCLRCY